MGAEESATLCRTRAAPGPRKAAYPYFSDWRVGDGIILMGHFAATKARFADTAGPILVQDR
jgi:hypothetical protein